jgi:hypothetical protein
MSNQPSRRGGLLAGLLAVLAGLLGNKPQPRTEPTPATPAAPAVSEPAPVSWQVTSVYDSAGRLVSCSESLEKTSIGSDRVVYGTCPRRPGNTERQMPNEKRKPKQDPPDHGSGEETA